VRWQDLKDLFRKAGTVLRADVSLGPDNRSRGYGTVLLATAEDAGKAVDMFNGYLWQTRVLEVRLDRAPPDYENNTVLGLMPSPTSVNYGGAQMMSMSHGSVPSNADYHSLFGLERPKSTGIGGRNLFVGNVGHPFQCAPCPLLTSGTVASLSLPMAGLKRPISTSRFHHPSRRCYGCRRAISRVRHRSACY
jgi:RNA recognition motif-containing protein